MKVIVVDDMSCVHCVARLTEALKKAGISGTVSLEKKTVTVDDKDVRIAEAAIKKAGYTPTL
jgi:copper chaperone